MATPPETNSASTTRILRPSRISFRPDLDRRHDVRQAKHVDRQARRHEVVAAVTLLDDEAEQADDDAAMQRFRVPWPVRDRRWNEAVTVWGEEGLILRCICHWRATMADFARQNQERLICRHSSRTLSSVSEAMALDASASNRSRAINCDSAQMAAPRTSALSSASRPSAASARPASPELPIAISTLRTKRSRPMRLTGDFEKCARKAASSSCASSRKPGALQLVARGELGLAAFLRELVPGADRETIVAAIDAIADRLAKFVRDRSLVLDGEVGNAAPRIELVGRGKRRGRTDVETGLARAAMIVSRPRRAAGRAWCRSRRETARSRTRARPG